LTSGGALAKYSLRKNQRQAAPAGGLFHFKPNHRRDVAFWHLADIRGIATFCPLLDKGGHWPGSPASMTLGNARRVVSKSRLLRSFPELQALSDALSSGMGSGHPKFHNQPEDCTCLGEGPVPVSSIPRVGAMPELITYQCPVCGYVETIEKSTKPNTST
jgi:hypothetical protein